MSVKPFFFKPTFRQIVALNEIYEDWTFDLSGFLLPIFKNQKLSITNGHTLAFSENEYRSDSESPGDINRGD